MIYGNIAHLDKKKELLINWEKMKPFKTLFYSVFLFFPFQLSFALSFDWSGWVRLDSYYQHKGNYYGDFHFALNSDISITDNLSFKSRWDSLPLLKGKSFVESYLLLFERAYYRQTGYVFLYKEGQKTAQSELPFIFPSQFYLDYQEEFFKVRLGRAPYHFGLGTTYSATGSPFKHWMSLYNQLAFHLEYTSFYVQPALLHNIGSDSLLKGELLAVLQAGFSQKDWTISALYQHSFKEDSFVELFGEYKRLDWDLRASSSYAFKKGTHFSLAFEGKMKLPAQIPVQLELKAGGISGDLAFHPNYDLALLFWNRWMMEEALGQYPYQIDGGQAQKGVYLSPRVLFSFFNGALQVQPLFLLARALDKDEKFSYELDLKAQYKLEDNLFFSLTAGALYTQELSLALLAQTAASF